MIIRTPSRIHISLIDLNGEIGRVDGGIGFAIDEPFIEIHAQKSNRLIIEGSSRERAFDAASKMIDSLKIDEGVKVKVKMAFKPHIGLGSGTQLMLGVGYAISKLYKINVPVVRIAEIMGRGGTSGIGTAAFEKGGFILDGGHSTRDKKEFLPSSASKAKPAPALARYSFPNWKIAIVIPKGLKVHGKKEVEIFQKFCPIAREDVKHLSHLILMKILPAVVEEDIISFGEGINEIQRTGFKKIEVELQDQKVKSLLELCQKHSYGAGLSSFGPAIYCLAKDEEKLLKKIKGDAEVIFCRANNTGARILDKAPQKGAVWW
jgi:beta-ribofuranosylaminobenzene 5'-phosphate synthase